jgi:RNA polymerase sigma-70 factor (ECF subfamily)
LTIRAAVSQVEGDVSPLLHRRLSDEALGGRLASGEAAAFDELYRRYVHRLAAYGAHLLGDAAAGDDVAQSALLKAYAALRAGRVPRRMRPWLYRIAHNAALDLVARRRELPAAELPERVVHEAPSSAGALLEALAALPERQREVYVLRELHGLRIDETCAELGLTSVQVEQALFAARNRLAEHLTFGERLNCVAVQRLASGPLDAEERRALKTHLRACSACRSSLGLRGRALSLLPAASLDWLRGLASTLVGGGAPVAAKVGVVVATASVAAGVPTAVHDAPPNAHAVAPLAVATAAHARHHVARPAPTPEHVVAAVPLVRQLPVAAPVRGLSAPRRHEHEREHAETRDRRPNTAPESSDPQPVSVDGHEGPGGGDGGAAAEPTETTSSVAAPAPVVSAPTAVVPAPAGDGDHGGGDGGSDPSGSSDGGGGGGDRSGSGGGGSDGSSSGGTSGGSD